MENFGEQMRSQEKVAVTREQVVEAMATSKENFEVLGQFIDQLQAEADGGKINLVELNKQVADIYVDLNEKDPEWFDQAMVALEDLYMIASQMDDYANVSYARMIEDRLKAKQG